MALSDYTDRTRVGSITIADIDFSLMSNIDASIISVNVEYSMDLVSKLTFSVLDIGLEMINRNYFMIGRDVFYKTNTFGFIDDLYQPDESPRPKNVTQIFEIADVSMSQGPGNNPVVQIICYPKAIQQMKRDRKPGSIKGNGTDFVNRAARKYGLRFFGEKTSKSKTINKASGDKQAESLWDVIQSLATDAKFVVFEVDGCLIFGSEKWLLNKWGIKKETVTVRNSKTKKFEKQSKRFIPIRYAQPGLGNPWAINADVKEPLYKGFELVGFPTLRVSDNNAYDGDGSLVMTRENATRLRPGMTIRFSGVNNFEGSYLITSVSFDDISPNPVSVSFRKPQKEEKDIKQLPIGKRIKQTNIWNQPDPTTTGKSSKQSRPQSMVSIVNSQVQYSPGELLSSVSVGPSGNIFPLPTVSASISYPKYKNYVVDYGNINLYSRPIDYVDARYDSLFPVSFDISEAGVNDNEIFSVILATVWHQNDGEPITLDAASASAKYDADGLHLGKIKKYKDNPAQTTLFPNQIELGNIDLNNRPIYTNPNGSISTVRSVIWGEQESGKEIYVLVPTVLGTGWKEGNSAYIVSEKDAWNNYKATGKHLGKFLTIKDADRFAQNLHIEQDTQYSKVSPAEHYMKLLRQQQLSILGIRFSELPLVKSSIYPLPTSASPSLYPYMENGLIESGNINLYSRPRKLVDGEIKTLYPLIVYDYGMDTVYYDVQGVKEPSVNGGNPFTLIIPRIGSSAGSPVEWSESEAMQNYLDTGEFLAKCSTNVYGAFYKLLLEEQEYVVLDSRFPDRNFTEGV